MKTPHITLRLNFISRLLIGFAFIFVMVNLDAVVDHFAHPEMGYFDEEHIIDGVLAAWISAHLLWILELHVRELEQALENIKTLEGILHICRLCKRIKAPDGTLHTIDTYIKESTRVAVTHDLCPDCSLKTSLHHFEDNLN